MMKRIIILLFLAFHFFPASSQRIKYKDLFPMIQSAQSDEQRLMLLKEYLMTDIEHPNANYLLAVFYNKSYKELDILLEYEKAMSMTLQAKNRLLKSQFIIDERELRKNGEYYLKNDSSEYEFNELMEWLKAEYVRADSFLVKTPPIYQAFTKSVQAYDRAIKGYAEICGSYASIDDLYMLYDTPLDEKLTQLKVDYDSTLYYLKIYRDLVAVRDIGYPANYTVKNLMIYKLQGLEAGIPFLKSSFSIWNYGDWVDLVKNTANSDIGGIRRKLLATDKELTKKIEELNYSEEEKLSADLDPSLIYQLEKYDFKALPVALLQYKEANLEWKQRDLKEKYYDTASLEPESRFIYYSQVYQSALAADSALKKVEDRAIPQKIKKHEEYIDELYDGEAGLSRFIERESSKISGSKKAYMNSLEEAIYTSGEETLSEDLLIAYGKKKFPASITPWQTEREASAYYCNIIEDAADGSTYFAGFKEKNGEERRSAYLMKYKEGKVSWLKEFSIPFDSAGLPGNNLIGALEITKSGVAFILHLNHEEYGNKNFMLYLNENGETEWIQQLTDIDGFPRYIDLNEETNRYKIAFRGDRAELEQGFEGETFLLSADEKGEVLWNQTMSYTGDLQGMIRVGEETLLVSNVSKIEAGQLSYQGNEIAPLLLKYNAEGQLSSSRILKEEAGKRVAKVVKVSDSSINLMGQSEEDKVHIMIDSQLRVLFSK